MIFIIVSGQSNESILICNEMSLGILFFEFKYTSLDCEGYLRFMKMLIMNV